MTNPNEESPSSPDSPNFHEAYLTKDIRGYRLNLRASARAYWSGVFDYLTFYESSFSAISRAYTQAWNEGAKQAGIEPEDYTQEETARLQREILSEQGRLDSLALFIEANRKGTGLLRSVLQRVELWVKGYDRIKQLAFSFASRDKKLKWNFSDLKQHCGDCLNLDGRVYRASIWKKHNIAPKMWELECHGIHCGCYFTETDEAVTPGRPPSLKYQ